MNSVVLTILSLSASGSVLALILFSLRPFLKNKVSKTFQYYIWLLVLLRLALPLSFDGSIMNQIVSKTFMTQVAVASTSADGKGTPAPGYIIPQGNDQYTAGERPSSFETTLNPDISAVSESTHVNIWKFAVEHLSTIWLLGALIYFGLFIINYMRFREKIRRTSVRPHPGDIKVFVKLRGNASVGLACNSYIDTPMMIGFPSSCIVIPRLEFVANGLNSELRHILRHELTHYRRRDLLYKWFVVLISSMHWFNPLMILVRREINRTCELSCDEAVIRSLDDDERQGYGETLLAIASNKRFPTGIVTTTMCKGKRELKERLENIMTYKSKSVLTIALSLVLTLLLAGCSVALGAANVNNQSPSDDASPSPTATINNQTPDHGAFPSATTGAPGVSTSPSPTPSGSNGGNTKARDSVLDAYKAVLLNHVEFYSTDSKKALHLSDFLTNKEIYETTFTVTRFAVLDMDGDKVPEVVLELSVDNNPQFFEVLHYKNGEVYGYFIVYRGLQGLKADGTFIFSNGAADGGSGKLIFESNAFITRNLAYSQSNQSGNNLMVTYFINDKAVTKKSFDSFMNEQSRKKDAVWYTFSQKNIETELSTNP